MTHKNVVLRLVASFLIVAGVGIAQDQEGNIDPTPPKGVTVDQVIQKFAEKEKVFKKERENYVYTQTVKVQTLDGDTVDGEYQQTVEITFDDKGRRVENVTYAPQNTLQRVSMSPEDYQDIQGLLPFVLTSDEINDYNIKYVGKQQVDELGTYVFDISPKEIKSGRRYFDGRIWVDDRDFQIVKTHGKPVPEKRGKNNENLFPRFTTYREQIDGKYWFPTYTRADDTLHFKGGNDVHIREIVKYTNYQRFNTSIGKITVNYGGNKVEELNNADPLTKDDILETLKGGTPAKTMTEIVKKRGVNFTVNADVEQEIRKAGGDSDLIHAIENNKKS